jgi:trans-aconitate 2-methyltransferase
VPEQDAALRSIRRAMKQGATAQLRLVPDGARTSVEMAAETVRRRPRWAPHFAGFNDPYLHVTPPQYEAAAIRAGLRVTSLDVADKTWDFGSRAAFHAFCAMGMRAWTEYLPDADRDAFVADVVDAYLRAIGAPPGEGGVFRFYQMDVALACAPPR